MRQTDKDPENQMMVEEHSSPQTVQLDPKRARFPCCIVWTPLPVLSWFIPFIGHIGICREDGVILDFAGPNFVCVDNFAFGKVARYVQIDKEKIFSIGASGSANLHDEDEAEAEGMISTWDDALRAGTQVYQHRAYSLLTCNCHSFVANNLNRMGFHGGGWNVVNLALLILLRGQWVSRGSMVRSFLPFIIVTFLGVILGGFGYLKFLAIFCLVVVGWFIIGSYWFKSLIQL